MRNAHAARSHATWWIGVARTSAVVLSVIGLVGGASLPATAAMADAQLGVAEPATVHPGVGALPADVDDFSFQSFNAEYALSATSDGRSQLDVAETLVAEFPSTDQNRGIVRVLPTSYNDVSTDTTVTSVTDATGAAVPYTVDSSDGITLDIGGDEYVHGATTYVIHYTLHNVIRQLDNGDQELYWNVNGTGWAQSFGAVAATVTVSESLVPRLTGAAACYHGEEGSTAKCTVDAADAAGGVYRFSESAIAANETVTCGLGFASGSFVVPTSPKWEWWATWLPLAVALGAAAGAVALWISRRRRWRDAAGRGTIIPEYAPPAGVDLLLCGNVVGATMEAVSATLVSLAMRGVVHISASGRSGDEFSVTYRGGAVVTDEAPVAPARATQDGAWPAEGAVPTEPRLTRAEAELLAAIFGHSPSVGEVQKLDGPDEARGDAIAELTSEQAERSLAWGLRARPTRGLAVAPVVICLIFAAAALVVSAFVAVVSQGFTIFTIAAPALAVVSVLAVVALRFRPHLRTVAGTLLDEYLEGNRMYIEWAEKDRLAYLQGALTAERIGPDQKVVLYERMLPIAVLLGLEQTWGEYLGAAFVEAGHEPGWITTSGAHGFAPAIFAAQLSGFHSMAAASLVAPVSTGAAGAGGGGFAGGGGGGGGGGGR